jgi:hypothetical protein
MKQRSFEKSIRELEVGDQILVYGNELTPALPEPSYEATVIGKKQVRTFGYQAMLLLDGMADTVLTADLDLHHTFKLASLEGQDFVWVNLPNIERGDRVRWWQDVVTIEHIEQEGSAWYITVTDPRDSKTKRFSYRATAALCVKIAEASEERQQVRMRRIAEHMLPSMTSTIDESPDDVAQRLLRHVQEWIES